MERGQAEQFVFDLLGMMISKNASDLFITAGYPPALKVDGKVAKINSKMLSGQQTREISRSLMNERQIAEFEATNECNFAISLPGVARFRVNAYIQRGAVGMVFRVISSKIPKITELGLPETLQDIAMSKRGW
jgi:twitching motility protein PilU